MTIVMTALLAVGIFLARIGMNQRGGDMLLGFIGSIAIATSGLWFLVQLLRLGCAGMGSD